MGTGVDMGTHKDDSIPEYDSILGLTLVAIPEYDLMNNSSRLFFTSTGTEMKPNGFIVHNGTWELLDQIPHA
jgi:hypothetical protein